MESSKSIVDLIAAAQANAMISENRIQEIQKSMDGSNGSDANAEDLCAATVALELTAIDLFSAFEARMQHHFKRGPFSRKLQAKLLAANQGALANRVHQHYLAINVLKHGTGASYRELVNNPVSLFTMNSTADLIDDDTIEQAGLVDVTVPGFFDGLVATIMDAYEFLEKK
jgi:hypothetical protein